MKFDYDKVTQNKTVIHCNTEEKAINLINWAVENDLMCYWEASDYSYGKYGSDTCLMVSEYGQYCEKEFYEDEGYTILSYDDVVIGDSKETFKKGDLVNGIRLSDNCKFNLHRYYGYCEQENKHLIHSNTNHNEPLQVWLVDKVEKVEMITKKQAKQEVSELFAHDNKPTSQMIRNIIDRIE